MSDLIEQLRAAGSVEAVGGFTIDPEKAREKLRQYQLADPHRYVLLLVEGLVLAGASRIELELDADDVELRCDARAFDHAQLENLWASLFVDLEGLADPASRRHVRGLQQVAFALNSAMALNPRFARIESVDPEGKGTRLELRPERTDELSVIEGAEPGVRIHVKERLRPGLVVEFFRSVVGGVTEAKLLREHCRWSRVPIVLGGKQISSAIEFPGSSWGDEPIREGGLEVGKAVLQWLPPGASQPPAAQVELLSNGVFMERVEIQRSVAGLAAIVDSSSLRKDVSQTSLVRDAGYRVVMKAVRDAEARLLERLVDRMLVRAGGPATDEGQGPVWAAATLREWLEGRKPLLRGGRLRQISAIEAKVFEVPLWPTLTGARMSTAALLASEPLLHTPGGFTWAPADMPFVLDTRDPDERALLEQLFGDRLVDVSDRLRRELEREQLRQALEARRHPLGLGEDHHLIREPIDARDESGPIRGELGLRSLVNRDSWIRLLHRGCLLQEIQLDHPIPCLCVVVEAELTPNDAYDAAKPDRVLAAVALELLRGLERMLARLAESGEANQASYELRELIRAYVVATCRRSFVADFLGQLGLSETDLRRELRSQDLAGTTPSWGFAPSQFPDPEAKLHPLAHVPLFVSSRGRPRSLAELLGLQAQGQRIAWLDHDVGPLPQIDREVLLLTVDEREALRKLLGEAALERYHDRLALLRERERFLAAPKTPLELPGSPIAEVPLSHQELRGALGLTELGRDRVTQRRAPVRVYVYERWLCDLEVEVPLPGLVGYVASEKLDVDADFRKLTQPDELRPSLLAGLPALVERVREAAERAPAERRRCEWWWLLQVVSLVLGSEGYRAALLALRSAVAKQEAIDPQAELLGLLRLLDRYPSRDLERALGRLRGRAEAPTLSLIEGSLGRPSRIPNPSERELAKLRVSLAEQLPGLLALPSLRAFVGKASSAIPSISLDQVLAQVGAGTPVAFVPESFTLDRLPMIEGKVLVLDEVEQRVMVELLGAPALEEVSEWLRGRAKFERRKQISEIRVPQGQVVVSVTIDEPGVRGELGIVRESPHLASRSKIRVFHLAREVTTVDLTPDPFSLLGALELDVVELTADHQDLMASGYELVRKLLVSQHERLVDRLIQTHAELPHNPARQVISELLRKLLVAWPPQSGGYAGRARRNPRRFAQIADLPLFPGARRPWTASELAEASQRGPIATIDSRAVLEGPRKRALPESPVVVLDRSDVHDVVVALFGPTYDLGAAWARQDEIERRRALAPRLPTPPADALVVLEIADEGLEGHLWLAARDSTNSVALGREGRVFGQREVSASLLCTGAVSGPGVQIDEGWTRATLGRPQQTMLERRVQLLWDKAVDEFERLEAEGSTEPRFTNLRELLRRQFLRLHVELARDRPRPKQRKRKGKAKAGNRLEQLYDRLWALRLLPLSDGHHISAEVAARERPIELASLSLWHGPSAEELAHQRALERREAERRREAELAARREEERERRRIEQQQAEREATERRRRAEREAAERERERKQAEQSRKLATKARAEAEAAKQVEREAAEARRRAKPVPTPESLLLDAIRAELRLVRGKREGLLGNHHLDSLAVARQGSWGRLFEQRDQQVLINADHPLFQAALQGGLDDPMRVTLLASATYSFLNLIHPEIADKDEAEFLSLHAAHASSLEREPG